MRLINADVSFYEMYKRHDRRYRISPQIDVKTVCGVPINVAEKIVKLYLENVPTVDPVKHGRWIDCEPEIGYYACSLCDYRILRAKTNYCPNCGAKMDEVKHEVD